jgi:hypothetical protein
MPCPSDGSVLGSRIRQGEIEGATARGRALPEVPRRTAGCRSGVLVAQSAPTPSLLIRLNGGSGAERVEIINELVKGRVVPFRDDTA